MKHFKDIKIGDFLKLTDRDKQGKFYYTGEVISVAEFEVTILTAEGIMTFQADPSNDLTKVTTKPKGWAKFKKNPNYYKDIKAKENKIVKTKKQMIFELVESNKRKNLKSLIKLAKKEIGGNEKMLTSLIQSAMLKFRGKIK